MRISELLLENELAPPKVLAIVAATVLRELLDIIRPADRPIDAIYVHRPERGFVDVSFHFDTRRVKPLLSMKDFRKLLAKHNIPNSMTIVDWSDKRDYRRVFNIVSVGDFVLDGATFRSELEKKFTGYRDKLEFD